MTLKIFIGKIRTDGGKLKRLKLGDPVGENDVVTDETIRGKRCIRCVAILTPKEAGTRRTKTWSIRVDHRVDVAGEEIRKGFEAEAEKWSEKVMKKVNGVVEREEVLMQSEL